MKRLKSVLFFTLLLVLFQPSQAAIYWVGDSAACTGPQVRSSLPLALLSAAASNEADEIRLTSTVTYTGGGNSYTLTDWSPNTTGALTIAGGYADCFTGQAGRTNVGNVPGNVFTIQTSSQPSSLVTLRNLQINDAGNRGLVAAGGAEVVLDNVGLADNINGGAQVVNGARLEADASSTISDNGTLSEPNGGGIQCTGNNSQVSFYGTMTRNQAISGGGLYVSLGCSATLEGGAVIQGYGSLSIFSATNGGGIYVDNGGELYANGGANRVTIRNHGASGNGGGLYLNGSGFATLLNTLVENNDAAIHGSAIYAIDGGGAAPQVYMDRANDCPFLISCSEIQNNPYVDTVVYVRDSLVDIKRTQIEQNNQLNPSASLPAFGMVHTFFGEIRLDRVVLARNYASYLMASEGGTLLGSHLTAAGNNFQEGGVGPILDSFAGVSYSVMNIENSIFTDTQGIINQSVTPITADCNLVDVASDWPAGSFSIGTPQFINLAGGDARQLPSSPGVDMCLEDSFNWTGNTDLEYQSTPVNENTNPQGSPGQAGGLYDAGADEVYANVGEDMFLLSVERLGAGSGSIVSTPIGIACGTDCSEVYFNETVVTLFANPSSGSEFIGWSGCPLPNGNECLISVEEPATVGATFQPDDLIFANGFE